MSPEVIIAALARLNGLLEARYHLHQKKLKKFKQLQMMLGILSFSVSLVLFVIYQAPLLQMLFILVGFNFLFFVGFKPRSAYNESSVKKMMQQVLSLQVSLKKFLGGERVLFDGVECEMDEGWICDKWGLYKEDERIDYGAFLYDEKLKGLYMEALRNKR